MQNVANDDEAGRPAIGVGLADGVLGHADLAALIEASKPVNPLPTMTTEVMFDGVTWRMRIRSGA
jgi:hypothetical protein